MAKVRLRIVDDAARAADLRAEALQQACARKPDLVLIGSTGRTPVSTYERLGELGVDLSRVKLRMLDAYLASPSRGFAGSTHPASFTRYVTDQIFAPLDEDKRPRDWSIPPEDISTCEEIAQALEEQPDHWSRVRHPITGDEGSEFVLHDEATGPLELVRNSCIAYEKLIANEPIDVVMTGIGPLPYPHLAFNCGPYTRGEAVTHLALLDEATQRANASGFGDDMDNVPPFSITTGPATLLGAREMWITATGSHKSTAVAHCLGDPRASDFEYQSSIAYVLRCSDVDLVFDEEAAEDLLDDGGFEGLSRRYAEAGHELVGRRI